MTFKLINAQASPFGRKVAVALEEKGLSYDVHFDMPWSEDSCTSQYSPLSQLPILITENGDNIYDSPYILEWLEAYYPEPALLPTGVDERLEAHKRQMLGERLQDFGGIVMFESSRPAPSSSWIERHATKVRAVLQELEQIYSAGKTGGLPVDMGDVAVVTTLDLFEFAMSENGAVKEIEELRWKGVYPALTSLAEEMDKRASFQKTRPQPMDVDMSKITA